MSNIKTLADTDRVEAFSDGVFAIIVTLLVLEIHRPPAVQGQLGQELLQIWPAYLSYTLAFLYAGIIWLNHHCLFHFIGKADLKLNWANLVGLGATALLPLPTGVMADAFRTGDFDDQRAAVLFYAAVAGLMSLAWMPIFFYLSRHPELLKSNAEAEIMKAQIIRPVVGIMAYILAGLGGWFIHPLVAITGFVFMVIYHAVTSEGVRPRGRRGKNA